MDELSSTEFRKRFARLTSPTVVTVNGHVIGEWRPLRVIAMAGAARPVETSLDRFSTRPFRPVPKGK